MKVYLLDYQTHADKILQIASWCLQREKRVEEIREGAKALYERRAPVEQGILTQTLTTYPDLLSHLSYTFLLAGISYQALVALGEYGKVTTSFPPQYLSFVIPDTIQQDGDLVQLLFRMYDLITVVYHRLRNGASIPEGDLQSLLPLSTSCCAVYTVSGDRLLRFLERYLQGDGEELTSVAQKMREVVLDVHGKIWEVVL